MRPRAGILPFAALALTACASPPSAPPAPTVAIEYDADGCIVPGEFDIDGIEQADRVPAEFDFLPAPDCVYVYDGTYQAIYFDRDGARTDILGILSADATWQHSDEINWNNGQGIVVTVREDLSYVPNAWDATQVLNVGLYAP